MSRFHVGFTGTRHGMSPAQTEAVIMVMQKIAAVAKKADRLVVAHHGDCVGADEDFHDIAKSFDFVVETHPGPGASMRASCVADRVNKSLAYLVRNRKIVDASAVVIATPFEVTHQRRGGTWYTVDYALKREVPLALVLPRCDAVLIEFSNWAWPELPKEMIK